MRSLAKHVLLPLQLTTEPPKTCLCDVWPVSSVTVFAFRGSSEVERQGLSLLKRAIPNSDMHLSF